MERSKAKAPFITLTVQNIRGLGWTTYAMDTACISTSMATFMKETGSTTTKMAREFTHTQTQVN